MTHQEANQLVARTAQHLGEHFSSVQIMVAWTENGQTLCVKNGCGDWYSRQGMAHEFINQDIAQEHARQLADKLELRPDDGE